MKKLFLIAVAAAGLMTANAQSVVYPATNFGSNWSIGLMGGGTTTLNSHQPVTASGFWQNMRGVVGINIQKQISPTFGLGIEGNWGINTSYQNSKCAFDTQYVGVYGATNLMNLLAGYNGGRFFEIEAVAGAGWGHYYQSHGTDWNTFVTKAGLNLNFNVSKCFTLALKPSVAFDMSDAKARMSSASYDADFGKFQLMVGATYHFGNTWEPVNAYTQADIDALNATINGLQAQLAVCAGDLAACNGQLGACGAENARLKAELDACRNRKPETSTKVVEKVSNNLESIRYVYFNISSSEILADQVRTVAIIADFMNNHPDAELVVKGYASKDGNEDFNNALSKDRANAVKDMLVNKYGIAADRISADGEGVSTRFSELSWNRVAICILDK